MQIFVGVPRGRGINDSGVVENNNFHRLLLAVCSETSDRICRIYVQDIQPFDDFSVVPK